MHELITPLPPKDESGGAASSGRSGSDSPRRVLTLETTTK
jgi:hypothetical protein